MKNLGLLDSRWAIILPSAISTWNLLVMRTSFAGIPVSLEESARIDGANDFRILFRIAAACAAANSDLEQHRLHDVHGIGCQQGIGTGDH